MTNLQVLEAFDRFFDDRRQLAEIAPQTVGCERYSLRFTGSALGELRELIERALPVEPAAEHPDCVTPVPDARVHQIAREFVHNLANDKTSDAEISMTWNEGVSLLNEIMKQRRAQNRGGDRG